MFFWSNRFIIQSFKILYHYTCKDNLLSNPKLYSTEILFNKREELIKKLKQSNYSDEDISVIFFKGSLEKAEEAKLDIDLKEQNSFLESENKID